MWHMIKWQRGSALGALLLPFSVALSAARSEPAAEWPNSFVSRIEALALMQTLSAEILASRSATSVLEEWCASHRLAGTAEPVIAAHFVRGEDKAATAEQRQRLELAPGEEVKFRRVQLLCGDRIFSEADNWYVPGRLTAAMNQLLETTTTPFGKAVRDLKPAACRRELLNSGPGPIRSGAASARFARASARRRARRARRATCG
jgi:chorismate-pyruvate lyase